MIWWGVQREPGVAWRVIDAASAFREERVLREQGWEAVAVVSVDRGEVWCRVAATSRLRADPTPPRSPRRVAFTDQLGRGGSRWVRLLPRRWRKADPFGRSGV